MNVEGGGVFWKIFGCWCCWQLVVVAIFFLRCPLVVVLVVVAVKSFGRHEIYIIDLLTN